MFFLFSKPALCAGASLAVISPMLFAAPAARADTTVVYEVTVKGAPSAATPPGSLETMQSLSTVYYKNNKSRTESVDSVVLYDGDTKTTTTLNPQTKTYTTTDAESVAAKSAAMNPLLGQIKFSAKTFVRPGGQTRTIAGRPTKNTKFTAIMKMGLATADAPANMAQMLPTITISGEEWMADGLVSAAQRNGLTSTGFSNMAQMNPMMGSGLKEFYDKLAAIKGFPLASTLSMKITFPDGAAAMMGASIPKQPIVVSMQAKSVSEEPLADTLFAIPEGYTKAESTAPAAPQTPSDAL